MSVNPGQSYSGDSVFENIYVHGKLITQEEAETIFNSVLVKNFINLILSNHII